MHRYRESMDSDHELAAEDVLRTTKAAMEEAEQRYHEPTMPTRQPIE